MSLDIKNLNCLSHFSFFRRLSPFFPPVRFPLEPKGFLRFHKIRLILVSLHSPCLKYIFYSL